MAAPEEIYAEYQADPTPDRLNQVVASLKPTIDYTLSSLQSSGDPLMKTRAKVLTAQAITRYDPSAGSSLPTWVSSQLMPLRRFRRQSQAVLKVPERIQLDGLALMKAEKEFADRYDREPDVLELADFSKIPVSRIKKIRETLKPVTSEAALGEAGTHSEPDYTSEAFDYVYHKSDYKDRKILEYKTGFGGAEKLPPKIVAQKLRLTPTQLSRRSARLALQIQEIERNLMQP